MFNLIARMMSIFNLIARRSRTPAKLVDDTEKLLVWLNSPKPPAGRDPVRDENLEDLATNLREMKLILYGNNVEAPVEAELDPEASATLSEGIFRGINLKLMIQIVSEIGFEARKDTTRVVTNLLRQSVNSHVIPSGYLERNTDFLDLLVEGYENPPTGIHYQSMLRHCVHHETVSRYLFHSGCWRRLLDYAASQSFDVVTEALLTLTELMTRHKTIVALYLADNYDSFFNEYHSKLLSEPAKYFRWTGGARLLCTVLCDPWNRSTLLTYTSSTENLKRAMISLEDTHQKIRLGAFSIFKLFLLSNPDKPQDVVEVLAANRDKLIQLLGELTGKDGDEQFKEDRDRVVEMINSYA